MVSTLDSDGEGGIHCHVNAPRILSLSLAMTLSCGVAMAEESAPRGNAPAEGDVIAEAVPPQVVPAAVAAVAKLGDEVVLGHYQVAVERMNPIWKQRTAKRNGGMESPEKQAANVTAQMLQKGISMISCKPQGEPRVYEVAPGTKMVEENGVMVGKLVFTKWLVLVPTLTKFRILLPGKPPRYVTIDSTSYQVAICDKDKNDWTFIDGSELKVSDLRGLFITLPQNLVLPPVEKHQSP